MSDSLQPNGLLQARFPCPALTPGTFSNECQLSWWCHPTISSSVVPFSSCLQSFPVLGFFLTSQLLASSGQSIGASAPASVLPVSIQAWFPLALTDISDYIQFNFSLWLTFVSCILFLEVHCRNVGFWRYHAQVCLWLRWHHLEINAKTLSTQHKQDLQGFLKQIQQSGILFVYFPWSILTSTYNELITRQIN